MLVLVVSLCCKIDIHAVIYTLKYNFNTTYKKNIISSLAYLRPLDAERLRLRPPLLDRRRFPFPPTAGIIGYTLYHKKKY